VPDSEALKALRQERAAIALQIENFQNHLKELKDRLHAIDVAIGNITSPQSESRPRWGSVAHPRKQLL
jgi:hypothetical protein